MAEAGSGPPRTGRHRPRPSGGSEGIDTGAAARGGARSWVARRAEAPRWSRMWRITGPCGYEGDDPHHALAPGTDERVDLVKPVEETGSIRAEERPTRGTRDRRWRKTKGAPSQAGLLAGSGCVPSAFRARRSSRRSNGPGAFSDQGRARGDRRRSRGRRGYRPFCRRARPGENTWRSLNPASTAGGRGWHRFGRIHGSPSTGIRRKQLRRGSDEAHGRPLRRRTARKSPDVSLRERPLRQPLHKKSEAT